MKKRGFTLIELLATIIVIGIITLIIVPTINNAVKKSSEGAFTISVQNIMNAIQKNCQEQQLGYGEVSTTYYFNNGSIIPELKFDGKLPQSGTITVDVDSCAIDTVNVSNGKIFIYKDNSGSLLVSYEKFETLLDKVNDILDSTDTLNKYAYFEGNYFKGAKDNNYFWYSGNMYRIMGKDANNNIRLISDEPISTMKFDSSSWYEDYLMNHMRSTVFQQTSFCFDSRTSNSSALTTCTDIQSSNIATLSLDEYNIAGGSSSYLYTNNGFFWTTTKYDSTTAYAINNEGVPTTLNMDSLIGSRPIITILGNTMATSGDGTKNSPFAIENMSSSSKLLLNTTSGDYVLIEGRKYRVIDKNETNGTKLVYDGFLEESYTNSAVTTKMTDNSFLPLLGLSSDDRRLTKIDWDNGNFFNVSTSSIRSYVGGVKIGEMYSSQSNNIEQKKDFWTMSSYDSSSLWIVYASGGTSYVPLTDSYYVHPAINIAPEIRIIDGNGTYTNPFILESK